MFGGESKRLSAHEPQQTHLKQQLTGRRRETLLQRLCVQHLLLWVAGRALSPLDGFPWSLFQLCSDVQGERD